MRHLTRRSLSLSLLTMVVAAALPGPTAAKPTQRLSRASAGRSDLAPVAPVPAKYTALYKGVSDQLRAFERSISAMRAQQPLSGKQRQPIAGVELLAANGNRLSALLVPGAMKLADTSLDRFKALGVGGVTLGIKVPMLLSALTPEASRYADFYATLANHIRARRMAVSVELGSLFCGTVYAKCSNIFAGSFSKFVTDTADQARIVIKRLHPDYLTLFSEPDTEAELTGVRMLDTPAGAARAVGEILARIGPHGRTRIGAGAPTWLPTSVSQAIAAERIDYLDTHIYPVGSREGANAVAIAAIARRARKPLVADEVWLYKTANPGATGGAAGADQIFRQDMFSFWEPLDARFLAATASWARKAHVAYVSAFWSWQFLTYLTWSPALDADSYPQLSSALVAPLTRALSGGTTTALGTSWQRELHAPLRP